MTAFGRKQSINKDISPGKKVSGTYECGEADERQRALASEGGRISLIINKIFQLLIRLSTVRSCHPLPYKKRLTAMWAVFICNLVALYGRPNGPTVC